MLDIFDIFNNRELAVVIWTVIFFVWILFAVPNLHKSLWGILRSAFCLWKYFLLMFLYITGCVFFLYQIDIWNTDYLKVTLFWFFGWTIVMFMNALKIGKEEGYLKKVILELLGFTAVISFISNFYSFHLVIELFIVFSVVTLAAMSAYAPYRPEYKSVGRFSNAVLAILGLVVLVFSLYKIITSFNTFATSTTLQEFAIPILLSLMFLPFAYGLSMYSILEQKRLIQRVSGRKTSKR